MLNPEEPASIEVTTTPTVASSTVSLLVADALYLRDPPIDLEASARSYRDLQVLLSIQRAVGSIKDAEALASRLLELTFAATPAERGGILLVGRAGGDSSDPSGRFETVFARARVGDDRHVRLSRTIAEEVVRDRVAVLANGVLENPQWAKVESLRAARVRSMMCVPMILFERVTGVLYLDSASAAGRFDEGHLELVTGIAGIAAVALDDARHLVRLEAENRRLHHDLGHDHGLIGTSPRMREVHRNIAKVATTDSTVLVRGETGTGKELVARAIHQGSSRARGPFVAVNCAAIPETLVETELFGHEKGAFTGALARKAGKLEQADGGSLFLDEVGELPLPFQAKLLRALQERAFERVGGSREVHADFRLLAATNRDLEHAVKDGHFRQDLYYRLNVLSINLPALRDRRDDIPLLAEHFVARVAARCQRRKPMLPPAVAAVLAAYDWPGNVRELENAIERAVVLGVGDALRVEDLPEALTERGAPTAELALGHYHEVLNQTKRRLILEALAACGGVVTEAARRLGLNPNYLHRLMNNLDLRESGGT